MAREKIVRMKVTLTIPYSGLLEGGEAVKAFEDAAQHPDGWMNLVHHPSCEMIFGDIEETSREPRPKELPAPAAEPAAVA